MSTFMAKKETVERKWYIIDAAGKPLGKTAVTAANSRAIFARMLKNFIISLVVGLN